MPDGFGTCEFLSTPSARRATTASTSLIPALAISIHALREEGDSCTPTNTAGLWQFLSTPSARRATILQKLVQNLKIKFLSTPSARRATKSVVQQASRLCGFLSTPSARRATQAEGAGGTRPTISIHALREEGDHCIVVFMTLCKISIHALREEGDLGGVVGMSIVVVFLSTPSARRATISVTTSCKLYSLFLSTPSARRATAKTERKHPAFVSLYTSLHKLQRDACKPNRKITPLLAQTAGIPVRSVPENYVCCRFALAGHQKISTLSWANSGCSPTCSTLVW